MTISLQVLRNLAKLAGITRVSDITGLDRVGIPVCVAVRPNAGPGAISVYNGKGLTLEQAERSAIMEGIERYSASLIPSDKLIHGSYYALGDLAVDPKTLIISKKSPYSDNASLQWVRGNDLWTMKSILLPASTVFFPYYGNDRLFPPNTDGLAAADTLEAAVLAGLLELIERDASSLAQFYRPLRSVKLSSIKDNSAVEVLEKFERSGIRVFIKDITTDVGIPVFIAISIDDEYQIAAGGVACDLVRERALLKCLLEMAQSRLTKIHGAREDLKPTKPWVDLKKSLATWVSDESNEVDFREIPTWEYTKPSEGLMIIRQRLQAVGMNHAFVVNLTQEGLPHVVRCIVPGLEDSVIDITRQGQRARSLSQL